VAERKARMAAGQEHCMRLDSARAAKEAGPYHFVDERFGRIEGEPLLMGDFVIARKDTPTSYHLAVTVDDHLQGVTLVTRGEDILPSTHVHVLLQRLLGYETPLYAHHPLLLGSDGKRLAKRDKSTAIRSLRESGLTPDEVFALVDLQIALP
jgi:glutamyl-Q tRNA(Asp) synthetase